jgi:hypothetical protein
VKKSELLHALQSQNIVRQMIHEIRHGEEPLPARRAARHDYTGAALRHAWLLSQERAEVVASDLSLKCPQQICFLHGQRSSFTCLSSLVLPVFPQSSYVFAARVPPIDTAS